MAEVRWKIDSYQEWLEGEGVPIVSGLAVDLTEVETSHWPRLGADAAFVHLDARGDYCSMYVCDIPKAGATAPQRHLYEMVVYVVDGRGSTEVEFGGTTHSFEWGRGSLFALPLNARYRHFNTSGERRARLACVTSLPTLMKLFRNERFIFDTDFEFTERLQNERFLSGEGKFLPVREHRHHWETNLIPDLLSFDQLRESPGRGAGSTNIQLELADGTLHSHCSEIPPAGYKKAHYHGDGYHIFQLSGEGYSLYWNEGEEPRRVDWKYGMLHSPMSGMWHQHFNVSDTPARYIAVGFGSIRYPFLTEKFQILERHYNQRSRFQIEYEDEDPSIRQTFNAERAAFLERQGREASALGS